MRSKETEAKIKALKKDVDKWMQKAWDKMGDTGSDEYLENCNEENFWFGYFRALEDIDDIHLINLEDKIKD